MREPRGRPFAFSCGAVQTGLIQSTTDAGGRLTLPPQDGLIEEAEEDRGRLVGDPRAPGVAQLLLRLQRLEIGASFARSALHQGCPRPRRSCFAGLVMTSGATPAPCCPYRGLPRALETLEIECQAAILDRGPQPWCRIRKPPAATVTWPPPRARLWWPDPLITELARRVGQGPGSAWCRQVESGFAPLNTAFRR